MCREFNDFSTFRGRNETLPNDTSEQTNERHGGVP